MLGWLYLYSRHRKNKRRVQELETELDELLEICWNCGHPRHRHAADATESCPRD